MGCKKALNNIKKYRHKKVYKHDSNAARSNYESHRGKRDLELPILQVQAREKKKGTYINNVLHMPLARDAKSVHCNNAQARAIDNGAGNMSRACVVVTLRANEPN